jgi:hypothetical protein
MHFAALLGSTPRMGGVPLRGSGEVQPSEDLLGVVSLFADDATGKEFEAMVNIINSLKVTPKDAK